MKNLLYLLLSSLLISCGGKDEKSEALLLEAAKLHNEAVAIHDSLMPKMKEINELKTTLNARKDSLVGKNDSVANELQKQIVALDEVSNQMKEWMTNIVEVPNNEEHHHHNHQEGETHDHHHDHEQSKVELTPEQMLEIQKEMKSNILKIRNSIDAVLSTSVTSRKN